MNNQQKPRGGYPIPRPRKPSFKRGQPFGSLLPRFEFREDEGTEGKLYQLHATKGWKTP